MKHTLFKAAKNKISPKTRRASEVLLAESPVVMTGVERTAMTISCRDTDYIPKVKDAGKIVGSGDSQLQVMHNGIKVVRGCYHGDWMENIIVALKGHHEPQEEKAFHEVLKYLGPNATMVELGAFWAYYSLWFNKRIKNAVNYCFEPDPTNLAIGKKNAEINHSNLVFEEAAAGSEHGKIIELPLDSDPAQSTKVKIVSVDGFIRTKKLKKIDLLHMDVQGVELDALVGASEAIKRGQIRFVIVSTHHYMFSGDPVTHDKCLEFITSHGGTVLASHSVLESYSGDGLIVASFDPKDKKIELSISHNQSDKALFRSYEKDLARLFKYEIKE